MSDKQRKGLAVYLGVRLVEMDLPEGMMVMACRDLFAQVDGKAQRKTQKPPQKGAVSWKIPASPASAGGWGWWCGAPRNGVIANRGGERLENETSGKSSKLGMH